MIALDEQDLAARLTGDAPPLLLDVRHADEWMTRRIPGSTNLPLHRLPAEAGSLDPRRHVVLVCESGERSAHAARFLEEQLQFSDVAVLAGGMSSWTGASESDD